jgi:hypothetical protein
VSGAPQWVVLWSDAHQGQECESAEDSRQSALDEACDLLRIGHTVHCIVGPDGVTIGPDEIEQYCRARSPRRP